MDNDRDRSPLEEELCISKKWAVKIQHCPISSKFDMWVDNDVSI